MIALSEKRLILFAGHYGSGKTNIALNYARALKSSLGGEAQVTVADLDIVKIDTFELWCWKRLLRVPWTARRSNQSILKEISPEYSLEVLMLKLKLQ